MPLTELTIKNLKPKAKLYRVADSNGLCLEITPSGSKLWRWRFYHLGKAQMAALGKYPDIPLAQARKLRDETRAVLQSGRHPTLDKKAKKLRNAIQGGNTFENSPSVDKKYLVADANAGISFTYGKTQLSYTINWRSKEFDGQKAPSVFGAISLGFRF